MGVNSCIRILAAASFNLPRIWPRYDASRSKAVNCEVKALVEATPISGPACVGIVPLASRVIMEPMTLQIASEGGPFDFASRWAATLAAVPPACLEHRVTDVDSRRATV